MALTKVPSSMTDAFSDAVAAIATHAADTSAHGLTFASAAEAQAGTDNTKFMTPQRVAQTVAAMIGSTKIKFGSFTVGVGSASNSNNITGVGFRPVFLLTFQAYAALGWSFGWTWGAGAGAFIGSNDGSSLVTVLNQIGAAFPGQASTKTTSLTSFDADGFTIQNTKVGTPSSATPATYYYIAFG